MIQIDISKAFAKAAKTYYKPIIEEKAGDVRQSKFGGIPLIPETEEWPCCPACNTPMHHFVQLNLATLPQKLEGLPNEGLLQMFKCINEDCDEAFVDNFEPFCKYQLLRVIDASQKPKAIEKSPVKEGGFTEKLIMNWEKGTELSTPDEPDWPYNDELTYEQEDAIFDQVMQGEKFLGVPAWVQGPEYPECPECGQEMKVIFQIDSEHNIDYMWGDAGCGHISYCPKHPHILAFGWACA